VPGGQPAGTRVEREREQPDQAREDQQLQGPAQRVARLADGDTQGE
jgi:hypothetical protein